MLAFLEELREENFDCISFLPGQEEGQLNIEGGTYIEKGEEIMGGMGNRYHISIFKQRDDYTLDFDSFEATLSDPLVYISHIINLDSMDLFLRKLQLLKNLIKI